MSQPQRHDELDDTRAVPSRQTKVFEPIPPALEALASKTIEAAFRVHRALGPGLLESVYEACVCHELTKMKVGFEHQVDLPVEYDAVRLGTGLRLDLWVDRQIVVELKAVEDVKPLHEAQLLTYMKLAKARLGFIINFNVSRLRDGIRRMVL
jgi:GxxExxY protein